MRKELTLLIFGSNTFTHLNRKWLWKTFWFTSTGEICQWQDRFATCGAEIALFRGSSPRLRLATHSTALLGSSRTIFGGSFLAAQTTTVGRACLT